MANEVRVTAGLNIVHEKVDYQSRPSTYLGDIAGSGYGPYPGVVEATTAAAGVEVDLTVFTTPGYVRIQNLSNANFAEYGIHNGSTFYPLGELLPGETVPFRFSRNVLSAGTFRVKGNTATVPVLVEAFEA